MIIFKSHERKKRFVRCKICTQLPNVIKPLWKGRIPPIATTEGQLKELDTKHQLFGNTMYLKFIKPALKH